MTDPKIKYDIQATASGAADVERLAGEFDRLDSAVDPALAERARALAGTLRTLGEQQAAVDTFVTLKRAVSEAADNLTIAQGAAQKYGQELSKVEAPTRAQAGQLEKLRDAVAAAKREFQTSTQSLNAARAGLGEFGIQTSGLAAKSVQLRTDLAAVNSEVQQLGTTAQGQVGFVKLVQDTDAARIKMTAAAAAVADFEKSLGKAGPATAGEADRLRNLQQSAALASTQFEALQRSTIEEANALRLAGTNTENLAAKARELAAAQQAGAAASRANAGAFAQQGQAAQASAGQQTRANEQVRESLQGIGDQLRTLQTVAAGVLGGQLLAGSLGDLAKVADGYTNLQARIGLVTGEGQALQQSFDGVFQVAQRTNTSLETTGNLFTRIAQAGKDIGLTTQAALSLTETINQAVQVSGASAEASDAAITQLIQGLQSGVLRGEEFNSVLEQAPRLAKALADGLGLTTGALRDQAQAGALTSQVVIGALQGQADVVAREFSKLPPTVGRAITNLSTSWTQYIGEADAANNISRTAASVINALAGNLDTLGTVLLGAGKAAAAYKAIGLAQTFIANAQASAAATAAAEREAVAKAQSTVANTANTAATVANTAAKAANATATTAAGVAAEGAAASAGRFSSILGAVKGFSLLTIATNYREIGTAIGEGIAKQMGYDKASAELEARMRSEEQAARDNAREIAAMAQAKELATNKSLELGKSAQGLVADFNQVESKGSGVTDALDKITKGLRLGDLQGVKDAGAALDALAVQGKISGDQVREALAKALSGKDLGVFEATARAAFDGSEQGARRLASALDAVALESLRRAGTSVAELKTGFSETATSALNDVDSLAVGIDRLGLKGEESGRALSGSLDKALDAATTERAVQAVIDRWQTLGNQGLVTGDQLSAGLDKARAKIDSLTPGVNGLDEALRAFGLKSQSELQRTADNFKSAWEQIRNSTQVGLADKARAFEQYAEAAKAANKGVVPSEIEVQREMLKIQQSANDTGKALRDMGSSGSRSMDGIASSASRAASAVATAAQAARDAKYTSPLGTSDQKFSAPEGKSVTGNNREERLAGQNAVDASGMFILKDKLAAGTLTAADAPLVEALLSAVKQNAQVSGDAAPGALSNDFLRGMEEQGAIAQRAAEIVRQLAARDQATQAARSSNSSSVSTSHTVTINLGGRATTIDTANAQSSRTLVDFMRALEGQASVSAIPRR